MPTKEEEIQRDNEWAASLGGCFLMYRWLSVREQQDEIRSYLSHIKAADTCLRFGNQLDEIISYADEEVQVKTMLVDPGWDDPVEGRPPQWLVTLKNHRTSWERFYFNHEPSLDEFVHGRGESVPARETLGREREMATEEDDRIRR